MIEIFQQLKVLITILLFFAFILQSFSQEDRETDSLQALLLGSSMDLNKQIEIYALLSKKYHSIDLVTARQYANQALRLSENAQLYQTLGDIYRSMGDIAIKQDSLELAKHYYSLAYENYNQQSFPEKLADILTVLGNIEFVGDQMANAMDYYMKGIEVSRENNFQRRLARLHMNIGAINLNLQNFVEAINNLLESLEISLAQNDSLELPMIYHNMGLAYQSLNDTSLAMNYFQKTLKLYQSLDNPEGIARAFISLSMLERESGNINDSFRLIESAMEQLKRPNKYYSAPVSTLLTNCYLIQGDNYLHLNNLEEALKLYMKAFVLATEIDQQYMIVSSSKQLSKVWELKANSDSALFYFHIFHNYSDSLTSNENIRKLAYLNSRYQYEQKLNQEKEARINQVQREKKKYKIFLIISSGLLFTILLMIPMIYVLRKKTMQSERKQRELKKKLEERDKELTTHVMYQMKKNEFILDISKKLQKEIHKITPENRGIIENIITKLEHDSNRNSWEEFELRFNRVHADFNKKLLNRFPDLTMNDLRLCAFVRLNMNTKEISAITYQTISSIDTARFRLRQKLGLRKDDNLIAFLNQF